MTKSNAQPNSAKRFGVRQSPAAVALRCYFVTMSEAIGGAAQCDSGRGLPHSKTLRGYGELPHFALWKSLSWRDADGARGKEFIDPRIPMPFRDRGDQLLPFVI